MSAPLAEIASSPVIDVSERCACGHADSDHDAIARRYCTATFAADLPRGCICKVVTNKAST